MTPYRDQDEDKDVQWNAEEDADGGDDSDDEPTVPCPYCRREILEDVPQCPYCESFISTEDHAAPSKPLWIIATALICLGTAVGWLFTAF